MQPAPYPHPQPAPYGAPTRGPAPAGRRWGLVVLGVVLLLGALGCGYFASYWQELADMRGESAHKADREAEDALDRMRHNDDKRPLELREEASKSRDSVKEAETVRNGLAGGGGVMGLAGIAALVVGARARRGS